MEAFALPNLSALRTHEVVATGVNFTQTVKIGFLSRRKEEGKYSFTLVVRQPSAEFKFSNLSYFDREEFLTNFGHGGRTVTYTGEKRFPFTIGFAVDLLNRLIKKNGEISGFVFSESPDPNDKNVIVLMPKLNPRR